MESDQRPGGLASNQAGENSIAGQGVATGAVVHHRHTQDGRRRIEAVLQGHRRHPVRIGDACRHAEGLVGLGQNGAVRDIADGRSGVGARLAVRRAGCAKVSRHGQVPESFEPIPLESQKNLRVPAQPAHFGAEGGGAAGGNRSGQLGRHAVGRIVTAITGA